MHPAVIRFNNLPTVVSQSVWSEASDKARKTAQNRTALVKHWLASGLGVDKARTALIESLNNGLVTPAIHQAVTDLGKVPTRATAFNWVNAYRQQGVEGLLPQHRGRIAAQPKWAAKALELYHCINSPSFALVAEDLKKQGHDATAGQVRRFINSMPHELGPQSPYRMGAKLYREKHKDFIIRSTEHIAPGFIYNGDGHQVDVYVSHPKTGKAWRFELTAFQDVASRCIVGWEISESENAIATMTALTRSIKNHQHIPSMLYVDNGSGYKSKMMSDECCGVYAQFDIEVIFAIPGNARAKWIERFFKHMEEHVGKRFESYCGPDHNEREKLKLLNDVKKGKRELPSLEQWITEFKAFLEHYHNSPHPEIKGKTRKQVWEEGLIQEQPAITDFVVLPRAKVKVARGQIRLHKRVYTADYLFQFNGKELVAGYDLHDDTYLVLYEQSGEFIMNCRIKNKVEALPTSRIEETDLKRLQGQEKRIQNQLSEKRARVDKKRVIDVDAVEELAADIKAIPEIEPEVLDMDLSDFEVDHVTQVKNEYQIDLGDIHE
ncbi:Mu transposase C-terminal domain-containing protein [Pseudoalteromonas luteoviolacea]|uniref:Integrase catalytic domain-containing protein n=1 Tax=Pseudoalteromonas luteoviolacea S4054 TaxID=1129367 RepID=A0A0F6ADC7_9GAMM|nr:Mu transposase C-terminal domain-containing protein [Pseudoalteromonas luteoviolacea]AOT08237.1 hypothetical protein S4054249_10470 [Pseudoalteromonas luteoviolacea]AOT13153.1 hypothetical protein S40542_10445 [Pseudoalteromonas luteoviolacea]AOT18065.1 hypothetical protein S4054_10440 [Pseudoalteromonas luteoviolacea]KKE84168.1 hypothetical protein N479_09725 [Pseudoalteromonas luteoviolacea S4054]KZN76227.1 hypothetical protein N481_07690 [Pseudoalteromonas luteoviolacea S4047-1]